MGVDGFRLDTVKHVQHDVWKEHRRRTRAELGQDFFLIGEVWGGDAQVLDPWFADDEMDAGFDFSFQGNALGWVQGRGRTVAFDRYLQSREKVRAGHLLSPYLSSHDVPGALFQLNGDKELFRLAALLELTAGGIPMIYYGEEVGRPGGDWPDNRSDMPWGDRKILPGAGKPRDEALRADYKKLIAIRRAHPAFSRGLHSGLSTDGDLLVFLQRDAASHDAVVVAINRGSAPATASFDAPAEWGAAPVRDVWTGAGRGHGRRQGFAPSVAPKRATDLRGQVAVVGEGVLSMAEVTFHHVKKAYGPVTVIRDLDLDIQDHEFMVLVGPSGCGKSTALRMIAGLEEITGGTIAIGDRVVNDVPPKDRDIAMVFQSYALYPHMTVRENLEFGLKIRKTPKAGDGPAGQRGGARSSASPSSSTASPSSSRAASASASPSAAPSCASPPSSCSTSRSPTSTPSCACRCAPRSRSCRSASRRPPSTSPTTRSRR